MTAALVIAVLVLAFCLVLATFVQTLYLESMRLRARDYPALEFFRQDLQGRLALKLERGALTFSLIKHSSMLLLGIAILGLFCRPNRWLGGALLEAGFAAWLTMLACSYMAPQLLYRKTSGRWLLPLVPALRAAALAVKPLVVFFTFLHSLAELSEPQEQKAENGSAAEDIDALIDAGAEEGLLEEEDRKLIHSVVAFGDKTVREVMTPRPNIVAVPHDHTLEQLRQLVINEQYSRIPVYEDTIDNVIGFVHVRDMFEMDYEARSRKTVREILRPIRAVPETKPVNDVLREMQADGAHIVIVVDEYGNTAGLATMEDVVEEILGEIRDEHEPGADVVPDSNGAYVVSGSFDVDNLYDLLGFRPAGDTESTTVGGLVTEWLGRVPQPGDAVSRDGIRIEVLAGSPLRVEQVRVSKVASPSNEP